MELFQQMESNFWQLPTLLLLVASALVGGSYTSIGNHDIRAFLLGLGAGFTILILIALYRLRVMSAKVLVVVGRIEAELGLSSDWQKGSSNRLQSVGMTRFLIWFSWAVLLMLSLLAVLNLLT
jgi:hypothetical protein